MKIIIEKTVTVPEKAPYYSVELINGERVTELSNKEFLKDAKSDAKWYKENKYPEAELNLSVQ